MGAFYSREREGEREGTVGACIYDWPCITIESGEQHCLLVVVSWSASVHLITGRSQTTTSTTTTKNKNNNNQKDNLKPKCFEWNFLSYLNWKQNGSVLHCGRLLRPLDWNGWFCQSGLSTCQICFHNKRPQCKWRSEYTTKW